MKKAFLLLFMLLFGFTVQAQDVQVEIPVGCALLLRVRGLKPDMVVAHIGMPALNGLDAADLTRVVQEFARLLNGTNASWVFYFLS